MAEEILVLDDLGISRKDFEANAKKSGLKLKIIWDEKDAKKVLGLINVKSPINKETLDKFPKLKFIAVAFTGYDSVDLESCRKKEISVFNVPSYSSNSVAELTIGLAISLLREIPKANKLIRENQWTMKAGQELANKKIGIVGTGEIGVKTAKYFKTFGCEIIAWSRSQKPEFKKIGTYTKTLKDLFSQADIISLHLPFNQETKEIIGPKEISSMKKTAFLINTARAGIINEKALIKALKDGKITGAAIDVFNQEPLPQDNEFIKLNNVILCPHIAYKTEEALKLKANITISNIIHFLQGKAVNKV